MSVENASGGFGEWTYDRKAGWWNEIGTHDAHDTHANEVIACCVVKTLPSGSSCYVRTPPRSPLSRLLQTIRERAEQCNFIYIYIYFSVSGVCVWEGALPPPFYRTHAHTHTHTELSGFSLCLFRSARPFRQSPLECLFAVIDGGRFGWWPTVGFQHFPPTSKKCRMTIIETVGCSLCERAD